MNKQFLIPAAVILALGTGVAGWQINTASAQAANAPAATQGQQPHRDFSARLNRHIDHLKAELKVTPAQEPLFNSWAQAMRDNAAERQKSFEDMRATRGQPHTAVDRLETGVQLTQLRVTQDQRYLDAFRPLYNSLNADQKKVADHMMAPRHFGHGHRHI